MDVKEKIGSAKVKVMLRYPFLGSILFNSPLVESHEIPTAATDGKRIIYNPAFIEKLTVSNIIFLLAHECMHVAFMHSLRMGTREAQRWNAACDIVINYILIEDKIGTFIEGGMNDERLYTEGKTSEGVYALLEQNQSEAKGHDQLLSPTSGDGKPMTQDQIKQAMEEVKVLVAQAAQTAKVSKAAGNGTPNLDRLIGEILNPKVDWRSVLNNFMVRCKDDIRSYARPNRRFATSGLIIPSPDGEAMDDVVVAVDCSGSISNKELSMFAAEIRAICNEVTPKNTHVMYFDDGISHIDSFEKGEPPVIKPHGGGGTAFSPIFKKIDELDLAPACCVVLTDLFCNDFGPQPDYPVLWISTSEKEDRPWGELTRLQ